MAHPRKTWRWIDRLFGCAFLAALLMAALSAYPGGLRAAEVAPRATEPRPVAGFDAIRVEGGIDLKLEPADAARVVVSAPADALSAIETRVDRDRTLRVRWTPGSTPRGTASVQVYAPTVRAVAVEGSGEVEIASLRAPSLSLSSSGAGRVRARQLQLDALSLSVSGAGDVLLSGQATRWRVAVSGSARVTADELLADDVTIDISGSGQAAVQARRTLTAAVSGTGSVLYRGSPAVTQAVSGSGSVRPR